MNASRRGTALFSILALGTGAAFAPACMGNAVSASADASSDTGSGNQDGGSGEAGPSNDGGNTAGDTGAPRNGKFQAVGVGRRTSCAVYNDGRLYCFGGNDSGQLGDGTTQDRGGEPGTMATLAPVDLGAGVKATQVALGDSHVCSLLSTGRVKCWGSNEQGQLGLEDNQDRGDKPGQMGASLPEVNLGTGRTATKLAAGTDFTCALLDNRTVKCWGRNANGQLGLGSAAVYVGRTPGDMGDALAAVDLGPGRTVKDIATGEMHVCALLDNDSVKCWGNNQFGQLGIGDKDARGRQAATMGANLPAINFGVGRSAIRLFAGATHNCAILDNSKVKCWGRNDASQLGTGDTLTRGDEPNEMGDVLPALSTGLAQDIVTMALGEGYSCAQLSDGKLTCFGANASGQHCVGDALPHTSVPLLISDLGGNRTLDLFSAGPEHVCGVFSDKTVRCWGANQSGQLGVGDRNPRGDTPNEIGSSLAEAPLP